MYQSEKLGTSAIGKLTRKKDMVNLLLIPVDSNSQFLYLNNIDFISLLLGYNAFLS